MSTPMSTPRSIARLIADGEDRLARALIAHPRLEAEVLLASRLGTTRGRLLLHGEDAVEPVAEAAFRADLERRAVHYPLQYLTGIQEFYSLEFVVDERVLIPRPETEMIVDEVLRRARSAQAPRSPVVGDRPGQASLEDAVRDHAPVRLVDVGTGSGCIAIAVAKNLHGCLVLATDISEEALELARSNAQRHGVADCVQLAPGDGLAPAFAAGLEGRADFVVSNPPYIDEADLAGLQAELQHEPRIALTPGPDGLAVTARLVADAPRLLRPGGCLLIELSIGRSEQARRLLPDPLWRDVDVKPDLQGIPRLLVATRR